MIVIVGLPLAWMALSSFKPSTELFKMPPSILPKGWSLVWYRDAFGNSEVIRYFLNSLLISGVTMIIDVVFGTFAAYSLVRFEYTGRKTIMMGVLAAYILHPADHADGSPVPHHRRYGAEGQLPRNHHRPSDGHVPVFRVAAHVLLPENSERFWTRLHWWTARAVCRPLCWWICRCAFPAS